jgi:hypothetical protein
VSGSAQTERDPGLGAPLDPGAAQMPISQAPTGAPPQGLEGAPVNDEAMQAPRLGHAPEPGAQASDPERGGEMETQS